SHHFRYIYTDSLDISGASESSALLKLGNKWGLQNLVEKTVKYLESYLKDYEPTDENSKNELCDLVVIAEEYDLELKTKCWKVLLKNVNEVVPCQSFLSMPKDMVRRLLSHPDFNFKDQLVLFEAIRDWGMNQVLQQNLDVNSLQGLIGEFLQKVDFKTINDSDFLDTILPSECLGKSELIAFFMARGLEIPRDLSYNTDSQNSTVPFGKTGRFKRGYKLPNQEMYKEHELRFRVDKKLRLLGVGFGFLFSNTDMGITVHCQGPWETRQWQDIIQTYCRVSWEKMQTADVRLMFSEPVTIEANHSYKVLVRVSRMSAGGSDVDLWGGTQGVSRLKMKDAEISFLKSAVDPQKEVEDSDTENKPGMITDLFYELFDGSTPTSPTTPNVYSPLKQDKKTRPTTLAQPKKKKPEETSSHRNYSVSGDASREETSRTRIDSSVNIVEDPPSNKSSTCLGSYSFRRNVPSSRIVEDPPSPTKSVPKKKSQVEEASSYYLANKPSSIRGSDALPAFLRARQPSVDRNSSWQIPSRSRNTSSILNTYRPREPSVKREPSATRETNYPSRRSSNHSNIFDSSPLSKYSGGISNIKSKYEPSRSTTTTSRSGYTPTSSPYSTYGSTLSPTPRYDSSSTSATNNESRYGSTSRPRRYMSSATDTNFATNSSGTSSSNTADGSSRYGSSTSARLGREATASPSRFTSSSRYGQSTSSPNTNRDSGMRSSGTSSSLATGRYGSSGTSSSLGGSSRYGSSMLGSTSSYNAPGSNSRSGISSYGTSGTSSSLGSSNRNESNNLGSSVTSSTNRYGSTSTNTTGSSLGSRYGSTSSTSTPSYLSSSRFGTSSPIGRNYTSSSNRFGSSIYRR
ncbi:UNVERIFIED_CONTAM: hypothetical protein GTU68_020472, partial [Idotea baltica]|nr:hypothetical protein [Idotea baltica]